METRGMIEKAKLAVDFAYENPIIAENVQTRLLDAKTFINLRGWGIMKACAKAQVCFRTFTK